jgi:hypothetical protein
VWCMSPWALGLGVRACLVVGLLGWSMVCSFHATGASSFQSRAHTWSGMRGVVVCLGRGFRGKSVPTLHHGYPLRGWNSDVQTDYSVSSTSVSQEVSLDDMTGQRSIYRCAVSGACLYFVRRRCSLRKADPAGRCNGHLAR